MFETVSHEELNERLVNNSGPVLVVWGDRQTLFESHRQTLKQLYSLFGTHRLTILLVTTEYSSESVGSYNVHGLPVFMFFERGQKKDVLFGEPEPTKLQDFVFKNFFSSNNLCAGRLNARKGATTSSDTSDTSDDRTERVLN
ncbi:MAG: hypothetical protein OET90_01415 [Desulfuromonadales bacterium]|nr:hypothetical protein [Desulfuromonadales bacterium]